MTENEFTPDSNPLHREPPIIDRHEPNIYVQRRSTLMPHEWEHRFNNQNQPIPPHPPAQNPKFQENTTKPTSPPSLPGDHSDKQSIS
jgi:hypothetical protein